MPKFQGKCSNCERAHYSDRKGAIIICDCWRYCPLCRAEMGPYTPDLARNTYGMDGKHDLKILMVCTNCSPPFYSSQKPVEVKLDEKVA